MSTIISYSFPSDQPSAIFQVKINGENMPVSEFPAIPAADYERISAEYSQMPPYCWIEPRFIGMHLVHAACAGEAEVEVSILQPFDLVRLHPSRKQIPLKREGSLLRFIIPEIEPRYFILNAGDLPLLCILIDPPEQDVPSPSDSNVVDFSRFLTDKSGKVDQTGNFRRALQGMDETNKILYIPAGDYLADTVLLRGMRDFKIYFAPGALIRTQYSQHGENRHAHGMLIDHCQNITIFGRGCLDHQGYEHFVKGGNAYKNGLISWAVSNPENPYISQSPLVITNSRDILLEGFAVRSSRNFNFSLRRSENLTLRHCKIFTPPACCPEYTDGYQINSCLNTLLENCFAFCNDDIIAAGHYFYSYDDRPMDNTICRGVVGWNARANGIRLGFYSHYDLGNFTFENCDFLGAKYSGVVVHPLQDAQEADRYQHYGDIRFHNCGFDLSERYSNGLVSVEGARINTLAFVDCEFDVPAPTAAKIHGHPVDKIKKLILQNVRVGGKQVSAGDKDFDIANIEEIS